jgi:tetratricopeptide (TPR) repeat protein
MTDAQQSIIDAERRMNRGDRAGAMTAVRRLLGENPDLGPRWGNVTWLAETLGDQEAALQAARRFFMVDPLDPVGGLKVATLMAETGRVEQALEVCENFCDQRPGDPAPQYYAGQFSAQLGDFDQALDHFRRALAFKPDLTATWEQIAALKTFGVGDPDIAAMETLRAKLMTAPAETRAPLLYAMGKAYDDLGDTVQAFARYAEGARLMAAERPWDGEAFQALIDSVLREMDRAFLDRQPPSAVQSDRPLFVTGAPRSGTTLVEQILASHSQVKGGGELNLFRLASLPLGDHRPSQIDAYAAAAARAGAPDIWTGFGATYLAFLDERFGFEGRIVDKTLNHTSFLGSIRLALPKAPIAWVRRDPCDTAWSCFRTRFLRGQDWSWSLPDIARFLHASERLYAHWAGLLGEGLFTIDYETLVAAPQTQIPRLLAAMDLSDEPGVHDFHHTRRAVGTASLAQVRKPMSAESVGGWRRYETEMAPFVRAFESLKR